MSKLKRVLICDEDPQIVRALTAVLRESEFEALAATTLGEALDQAALHPLEAAIIELLLPDGDGVELCHRLREWSELPILILSRVSDEDAKIRALEAGADDYVTKPFDEGELIARLKAILRRAEAHPEVPVIVVDSLEVDLGAHRVRQDGSEVRLTPIEYELLRVLVMNRGRLMTHRDLLCEVWGSSYEHDKQTLQSHMANLRRKIDRHPDGRRYILTDFGLGYRFVADHDQKSVS
jgi:two-component system KDP operon response regulator KdpE